MSRVYKVVRVETDGTMMSCFLKVPGVERTYRLGQITVPMGATYLYAFDTRNNAVTFARTCNISCPGCYSVLECEAEVVEGLTPVATVFAPFTATNLMLWWDAILSASLKRVGPTLLSPTGTLWCRRIEPQRVMWAGTPEGEAIYEYDDTDSL